MVVHLKTYIQTKTYKDLTKDKTVLYLYMILKTACNHCLKASLLKATAFSTLMYRFLGTP
jgi:hypothetical protein